MSKNTFVPSVLVIEDESSDYNRIVAGLLKFKYKINKFEAMRNAIQSPTQRYEWLKTQINKNHNNLRAIICDLKLFDKEKSGEDIIQHIRNMKLENRPQYTRFIPIIIYTAYTTSLVETAILRGGTLYIDKGSDNSCRRLADIVKRHVDDFSFLCDNLILKRPFKIGLTFRGNNSTTSPQRPFVEEIANNLAHKYGTDSVFYDKFHPDKLNGLRADKKLNSFYKEQCEYILVFLSADYATSEWTGIEWKAVEEYAKTHPEKIILFLLEKFETSKIKDLKWAIYQDASQELDKFNGKLLSRTKKENLIKRLVDDIVIKKMES
jgi:CheY-like chemotaxis protein